MRKQRIYLDTSVIGGCFDREFEIWSNALMKDIEMCLFIGVTSEVVEAEIADAPQFVQNIFSQFMSMNPELLKLNEEVFTLVEHYTKATILPEKYQNDMLHIALATIANVDSLVSWNFKYIVRFDKIRQFNAINLQQGYHTLDIYSPREVTSHEKD